MWEFRVHAGQKIKLDIMRYVPMKMRGQRTQLRVGTSLFIQSNTIKRPNINIASCVLSFIVYLANQKKGRLLKSEHCLVLVGSRN